MNIKVFTDFDGWIYIEKIDMQEGCFYYYDGRDVLERDKIELIKNIKVEE